MKRNIPKEADLEKWWIYAWCIGRCVASMIIWAKKAVMNNKICNASRDV